MARELGLNPDKLGKIDNHRQEPRKAPLPQFIEDIYFKRFKREEPETVRPLKQILKDMEIKKQQRIPLHLPNVGEAGGFLCHSIPGCRCPISMKRT